MRFLYFLSAICICSLCDLVAQPICNGSLPPVNTPPGSTFDPSNGGFDWTSEFYQTIVEEPGEDCGPRWVESPFYDEQGQLNTQHFGGQITKDFAPEMGWELVKVNFGEPGNGTTEPCDPNNTPSLILYNRYTATLRCFHLIPFATVVGNSYNKAYIQLKFGGGSGEVSAALEYIRPGFFALDNFTKGEIARGLNTFSNGNDLWLYADFPINYDPCTPFHNSQLNSEPILQSIAEISLTTEGGGTVKPVVTSNSSPVDQVFNSLLSPLNKLKDKGNKYTKSLDGFYTYGQDAVGFFDAIDKSGKYSEMDAAAREAFNKKSKDAFTFPKWMKDFSHLGHFVGLADILIGGSSSSVTNYEVKLDFTTSGSETTTAPYTATSFLMPGAYHPNPNSELIPEYDNVLGGIYTAGNATNTN